MVKGHAFVLLSAFCVTYHSILVYTLNHPVISTAATPATPVGDYTVGLEQLASMSKDQNVAALQQYGGASLQHIFWLLAHIEMICFANMIYVISFSD